MTGRVSSRFGQRVRSRGADYFHAGHVQLYDFDPEGLRINATVLGSQAYLVSLEFKCHPKSWVICVGCTCPHFDGGDYCKHIWATLLAFEEERGDCLGRLGPIPARVSLGFLNDGADDLDGWDDDPDEWVGDDVIELDDDGHLAHLDRLLERHQAGLRSDSISARSPLRVVRGRSPKKRKPDPPPAWKRLLLSVSAAKVPDFRSQDLDNSPIEPIYLLEAENSKYARDPVLSVAHQTITAAGKPGKIKRLVLNADNVGRVRDETDRRICLLLLGAEANANYYNSYDRDVGGSRWTLSAALQRELFPQVSRSGRFLLRTERGGDLTPLVWDEDPPWEIVMSIRGPDEDDTYSLEPRLRRGDQYQALERVAWFFVGTPTLFVLDGVLGRVETHGCDSWLEGIIEREPARLSRADLPKLLAELKRMTVFPPIEWPPAWKLSEIDNCTPRPKLALKIRDPDAFSRNYPAQCEVRFGYAETEVNAQTPGRWLVDVKAQRLTRRSPELERGFLQRLLDLGAKQNSYRRELEVHPRKIPAMIATLLGEGWEVAGNKKLYRRPGEFKIEVKSGIDWFELNGQVDFDGQTAKLPELLAALRKGEQFVRLGDGSFGMLPEQWLARHQGWMSLGRAEDGHLRFSKTQIGLIDALLAEMPEATFDENLAAARQKLQRFNGVKPRKAPRGFRGELRPYQREGLGWLLFLDEHDWGGCLADDMGLGKTVQILALLADRRRWSGMGPSLVLAPKSVVFNWIREAERFAPKLRVMDYTGLDRKALRESFGEYDLILSTYGTLRRDITFLREQAFNYVVLDEAQAIKNPNSQSAKAARLLPARRRLALTGTPVENHLGDLWSICEFLNPGMLGAAKAFRNFVAGNGNGEDGHRELPMLARMLRPFILRRTKKQVAPDLPERIEQTIDCELPPKQAAYYKELRDHYRASLTATVEKVGLARSKMHVLEALLRLRQAACHPGLIDESKVGDESAKLDVLLSMITDLLEEGHKALIFSQFTKMLAIVRTALDQRGLTYEYLDGKTYDRPKRIDRFQSDPDCRLFLISLKAGGTGLNLTAADYVFILDPWWNPAVEAQAIDRTHRIGQDKKVIAYRLIARDTVEAKILELQRSKRALADAIITQKNSLIRTLTREDLNELLS